MSRQSRVGFETLGINLAKLNCAVESWGLFAGEGVSFVVAGKGGLVEDGAVAADEAPVGRLDHLSSVILQGKADVEDLAGVLDVGVVTVSLHRHKQL